ncbi:TonB-dependent receptor [Croceibacterium sp. TMG7-5b_MA50]|uniref:TonB-dependent receptor n=1 Tax=Croceibacterium sp. TMG7-5b_MA50 TaxID=3121290 RepID=UPI0032221367
MLPRHACCLLLTTTLVATPLSAQEATGVPQDTTGTATNGNDIIVTAQKIAQRAQDVPITISAVTGERIEELGVTDLDELSNYIPGLNIQEQSANNPGIVIRGVTSDSGSAQQGPRVTLYYNGVDISRSRGSYQSIYDLERVEVIKGPQATLFGTASAVGAISLVSARPRPGFSAEVTGGYGNYDATLLTGFVNAGNDLIAGRVAFEWRKRDGYVENLSDTQDDLYARDNLGVRASLRFTPSADVTLDVIGTFDRQRNSGTPFISRRLPPGDPFGPANLSGSPYSADHLGDAELGLRREVYDLNGTLTWQLNDEIAFTTVNGYREFDSDEVFDADGSAAPFLEFAELAEGWQFSHEGRFAYAGDVFRGSVGWNYFTEDGNQGVPFSTEEGVFINCLVAAQTGNPAVPGVPCVSPNGTVPGTALTGLFTGGRLTDLPYTSYFENRGQNDAYSVFADLTAIMGRVEVTGGLRYLWEDRRSGYTTNVPAPRLVALLPAALRTQLLAALPSLAVSLVPGQVDTGGQVFEAEESYDAWLPRMNILFRATDAVNFYATVSKGRRSPVVQVTAARVAGAPIRNLQLVPEETVWNYEAGAKLATADVSGTLGVFYQTYDGFQVSVTQPDGSSLTQSAGSASNLGVEAELQVRPTDWLSLFANGAYIDAQIDDDAAFAANFAGARFRLQPKWQAAGGFTVDRDLGNGMRLFATPSVTYRSKLYFELPNSELLSQGPVTLVNARAGVSFADERFEVAGFIRNAFNRDYLLDAGNTGGGFGIPTFIPAEPRFYGIEATARLF